MLWIKLLLDRLKVLLFRLASRITLFKSWRNIYCPNTSRELQHIPVDNCRLRAYIYRPKNKKSKLLPVIVYYHGGGFIAGNIDSYDPLCRDLCEHSGNIIVSVGYRQAPEFSFPSSPNDCYSSLEWVTKHAMSLSINPEKIFVAGDGTGGNLAAVTAIKARELMPGVVTGQILICPVTDHGSVINQSYVKSKAESTPTREQIHFFWRVYLKGKLNVSKNWLGCKLAVPMKVENLKGLPSALVITAEHDFLFDQGLAYAKRMTSQGVHVQGVLYKGKQHGFFTNEGPSHSHQSVRSEIIRWIAAA